MSSLIIQDKAYKYIYYISILYKVYIMW